MPDAQVSAAAHFFLRYQQQQQQKQLQQQQQQLQHQQQQRLQQQQIQAAYATAATANPSMQWFQGGGGCGDGSTSSSGTGLEGSGFYAQGEASAPTQKLPPSSAPTVAPQELKPLDCLPEALPPPSPLETASSQLPPPCEDNPVGAEATTVSMGAATAGGCGGEADDTVSMFLSTNTEAAAALVSGVADESASSSCRGVPEEASVPGAVTDI
jgi:hypothetical protein